MQEEKKDVATQKEEPQKEEAVKAETAAVGNDADVLEDFIQKSQEQIADL